MGVTLIICWFICNRHPKKPQEVFTGDPFAALSGEDETPLVKWLQEYVDAGPCTSIEKGANSAVTSAAELLAHQAGEFLNSAHNKSLSEERCCDFLEVVQNMLDLPRQVASGREIPGNYTTFSDSKSPESSYAHLLAKAYVQAVEEIEASRILAEQGGEDRTKHHVALCGDITSIIWTALNDYRCPDEDPTLSESPN